MADVLSPTTFNADVTLSDGTDVVLNTTTGTKIGTGSTQKLGFWGATPVAQQANTVELVALLSNLGLRASGGNPQINTGTGSISCGTISLSENRNILFGTTTGTQLGTSTNQKLAFWNATPIVQPANTVDLVDVLDNLGLRAAGGNPPLDIGTGALNAGATTVTSVLASGTVGVGYATGAGGTVTQATSRITTVVLSKLAGTITLFSTTLAADTDVSFTWTNTLIAATDVVVTDIKSGAAVKGGYSVNVICGAGTATVTVHNHTPTITATEAPVISFVVIKGVTS